MKLIFSFVDLILTFLYTINYINLENKEKKFLNLKNKKGNFYLYTIHYWKIKHLNQNTIITLMLS